MIPEETEILIHEDDYFANYIRYYKHFIVLRCQVKNSKQNFYHVYVEQKV